MSGPSPLRLAATLAVLLLAMPLDALAQTSNTARAAARDLGTAGVEDFQKGDFAAASDKLERAFKVVRAPSIGLWSARALVKAGKWVEAAERYLEVTRLDPNTGDVALQKQAQADAAKEREELLPRLPTLVLAVKGASESVELRIDGAPVPSALLGAKVPINPGSHSIEARDAGRSVTAKMEAGEGAAARVELDFTAPAGEPGVAVSQPAQAAAAPQPAEPAGGRRVPTAAWIAFGVGGAGVVVGAVTGVMAMGKKDGLSSSCNDNRCDPARGDDVDSYNDLRTFSTIGFIAGGVGLAAFGALYFTAPRESATQAHITPYLSASSAGLSGRF